MKKLLAGTGVAALAVLATPAISYAAVGGPVTQCRASFVGHPENSAPPWADDTFTRTTTIKPADSSGVVWAVHIADAGHFTTRPGTKSDSGDVIADKVTGTFTGGGDYTVTSKMAPHCIKKESYDGSNDPATGNWPLHYFDGSPVLTQGINPWHWDYATKCEQMSEDSAKGTTGNMTGKVCPTPTPTPTDTTPAPSPSDSAPAPAPSTTTPGEAPAPTPVKSDLPVTG